MADFAEFAGLAEPDQHDALGALVAGTDIPPADQSAWQRWELASFGDNRPAAVARAEAEKAARAALTKQLSQQISDSRESARSEGFSEGHRKGYAAGHAEGLAAGREAASAERERLALLAGGLSEALSQADEQISQDLLSLAMDIAKAMLGTAMAARPALLLPLITQLVREMPVARESAVLLLQADDAELVREHMGEMLAKDGWSIRTDHELQRGGCRIETATRQIDADIALRWKRIAAALGKDLSWLDDDEASSDTSSLVPVVTAVPPAP